MFTICSELFDFVIIFLTQIAVINDRGLNSAKTKKATTESTVLAPGYEVAFALEEHKLLYKVIGIEVLGVKVAGVIMEVDKHAVIISVLTPSGVPLVSVYYISLDFVKYYISLLLLLSLSLSDIYNCVS